MNIPIPPYVAALMARLESFGYPTWCVGGCVRDSLLGRVPQDWDLATAALPQQIKACLAVRTIDKGLAHGTVAVPTHGGVVEITTFRRESAYTAHRRPAEVFFASRVEDDLARRDFTVNAMAYHPERGLIDRFGGLEDLHLHRIRCVGLPRERFTEDALRMLRCLRFAAALGFDIEGGTLRAARECRELLRTLSGERTREELTKLLCGVGVREVLEETGPVFFAALPELAPLAGCAQECRYHCYDCWEHTLRVVEGVPPEPVLRWAGLLHDCGKPEVKSYDKTGAAHFYGHARAGARLAGKVLRRLRFPNREAEGILRLIELHGVSLPVGEKRMKRLLGEWGEEGVWQLLDLVEGDVAALEPRTAEARRVLVREARELARVILARGECLTLGDLAVDGDDLMEIGFRAGRGLGEALRELLEEVLAGRLANERGELLAKAREWTVRDR